MNYITKIYQRPLDLIDGLVDGLTSYRLVLYFLLSILGWSVLVSFKSEVPFSWHAIVLSAVLLTLICRGAGELFSRVLNIARNNESDYITALILALIMSPAGSAREFAVLAGAGFAAIASKYLVTIGRRHIFNPAAAGAFLSGLLFGHYASWWVGTAVLAPLVFVGGVLIMRKMKRFLMVGIFMSLYLLILVTHNQSAAPLHSIWLGLSGTGVMFFAYVMLTEPLTSPDGFYKYVPYAFLVAILYSVIRLHISPEEALLIGNLLAYSLVRDKRLELSLAKINREADGIYSFVFNYHGAFSFRPGQYMEWTLPLAHTDKRGNRRYMTLSSSPTEHQLMFSVRLPKKASHFKQALAKYKPDDKILASHLSGSFLLPNDSDKKIVFVAGGIGITPFRSMIKYVVDSRQDRQIDLLYAANNSAEFAFTELFKQAEAYGVQTKYVETANKRLSSKLIGELVPDYDDRLFYISGPYGFVKSVRSSLLDLGVNLINIKSDYFPGYG